MLDGVEWAAAEIVFYMLLATLIGFAIAYVFIRWFQTGSIADSFEAELAAQQELTRKAEHRLIESNESLDKVQLELRGEQQRVGKLQAELESAKTALAELEAATPDESEVAQLQADLESSRAETAEAVRQIAELESAKTASDEAAGDRAETVEKLEQDLAEARLEAVALQQRVTELESAVAECAGRRDELESQVEELAAARISGEVAEETGPAPEFPAPSDREAPSQEEGLERIAEIAARTAGAGPRADDDLKKVHGIGPKLERTLKDLGISSYRQIANFEADDISYVTAALDAFKGRIERDDWMGSAAAEHMKKYGEPA